MNEDKMEAKRLRQALWGVYAILGFDTNGDATPDALVSDIAKLVTDAAKSFRAEYDEAIASAPAQPVREPMSVERESDRQLMDFYSVDTLPDLIDAQARHIERLQDKLPQLDPPAFTRVREG